MVRRHSLFPGLCFVFFIYKVLFHFVFSSFFGLMSIGFFNWEDFGEFRVPSQSESTTNHVLHDVARLIPKSTRPYLFLDGRVNTHFRLLLTRLCQNLEKRNARFNFLKFVGHTLVMWLMRLETCASCSTRPELERVTRVPSADLQTVDPCKADGSQPPYSAVDVSHTYVFDRLCRVFRLCVYQTNLLNAIEGLPFFHTSENGLFSLSRQAASFECQKHFMATQRKRITGKDDIAFDFDINKP